MKCPYLPCSECAEICPNRVGGHWSRKEAVLLISLWPYETPEQIGGRMGRSADACAAKYRSLRNVTYAGRNQTVLPEMCGAKIGTMAELGKRMAI